MDSKKHADKNKAKYILNDDDLVKLDQLKMINASARFDLLLANQQILNFHLNKMISKNWTKKKSTNVHPMDCYQSPI